MFIDLLKRVAIVYPITRASTNRKASKVLIIGDEVESVRHGWWLVGRVVVARCVRCRYAGGEVNCLGVVVARLTYICCGTMTMTSTALVGNRWGADDETSGSMVWDP
jgi:hypothetical protein